MRVRRIAPAAVVFVAVFGFVLSGCGEQQEIRDLENVVQTQPDKARLVTNVNQYPNMVAICVEGAGFATTTRDYDSMIRVEAWDSANDGWCARDD